MAEHMRMRGRHLQTPIRCHVHPDTGRRVWLVGMVHHGEPRYYHEITQAVAAYMAAGAVVHAEGTPPPEDRSLLTPQEREVLDEQDKADTLSAEVYAAWGWVKQSIGFGRFTPQGWQRVDLTMLELISVVGADVMLASL